ncbi:MAG: universal stress protein [Hyphomonadaceae bacterium]
MAWKDVLIFADGSENGLVRAGMAADLAVALDADLEVCVPVCLPALSASGGVDFAVEVYDELERDARDDATRAAVEIPSRLPELAGRLAVGAPETRPPDLAKLAGFLGQSCDLTIVGLAIREDATRADDALVEGALFRSGGPCLMFPQWNEPRSWGKRVLIAWKDVCEAARAVHDAVPLLQRAEAVGVATIQHGLRADRAGERPLERLPRHLGRFGVRSESRIVPADGSDGVALLDQAERWSADLLVMGDTAIRSSGSAFRMA